MKHVKLRLIDKAKQKFGAKIKCLPHKGNFEDCFTKHDDVLHFWFNTEDDSTKILSEKLELDSKP